MKTEKPGVFRAWVLASRPKTLAAAAVPVLVGCALAYSDGCFRWPEALLCTLFAFLMQIDANLINDLFDYLKGSDRGDRLGPRRACAEGWIAPRAMKRGILCTTLAACVAGLGLLRYGGPELIAVGAVCVLFAFLYTAGPYPLAYHGWGDLLVVLFFGFVPVGCIYYIMCHSWTADAAVASLACGLAIDTLLMLNNYRDREQDALSGKRTLVVRFGARVGRILYLATGSAAVGRSPSVALSAVPCGELAPDDAHRQRQGAQRRAGRDLAQHVAVGRAAFARADTRLNRRDCRFLPIRVFGLSGFSLKVNGFVR